MTFAANPTIRVLTNAECWQRLADHPAGVGRVGTGGPSPGILPVNYVFDGQSVVFRTGQGCTRRRWARTASAATIRRSRRCCRAAPTHPPRT